MTELEKAIAEVRHVTPPNSPWEAGDIGVGSSPVDYHIATILNAVASGELALATEREAAVAAALQEAAKHIVSEAERLIEPEMPSAEGAMKYLRDLADEVLAMITRPQAAALARVRADAVKIKPLVWKPVYSSGNYSRSIASGEYRINEVGLCGWELLMDENNKIVYETCDMAKAAAQADHEARIRAAIGGVE
jgi:hypothetical protein